MNRIIRHTILLGLIVLFMNNEMNGQYRADMIYNPERTPVHREGGALFYITSTLDYNQEKRIPRSPKIIKALHISGQQFPDSFPVLGLADFTECTELRFDALSRQQQRQVESELVELAKGPNKIKVIRLSCNLKVPHFEGLQRFERFIELDSSSIDTIEWQPRLTSIEMVLKNMPKIPEMIGQPEQLRFLHISGHPTFTGLTSQAFESLIDPFNRLAHVQTVTILLNATTFMPTELFHWPSLGTLTLNMPNLRQFPKDLNGVSIRELYITAQIDSFPESLCQIHGLSNLSLTLKNADAMPDCNSDQLKMQSLQISVITDDPGPFGLEIDEKRSSEWQKRFPEIGKVTVMVLRD